MDLERTGRVAVVTGASKGIASAITKMLAEEGVRASSDDDFEWAMRVNFFSALRATRAALGHKVEHGSGSMLDVASVNAFFRPDAATARAGRSSPGSAG